MTHRSLVADDAILEQSLTLDVIKMTSR